MLADATVEDVRTLLWLCRQLELRLGSLADVRDFLLFPQLEFDARSPVALLHQRGREGAQIIVGMVDAARRGEDLPVIDDDAGSWDGLRARFATTPVRQTRRRSGNRRRPS